MKMNAINNYELIIERSSILRCIIIILFLK